VQQSTLPRNWAKTLHDIFKNSYLVSLITGLKL